MVERDDFGSFAPMGSMSRPDQRVYRIPVSTGILSHSKRMRDAVWLLLYFIDKTTREEPNGQGGKEGLVYGGMPVCDKKAAEELGRSERTIRRWRCRLARLGYITQKRTAVGYVVRVQKSKKWAWRERRDLAGANENPNLPVPRGPDP